MSQQTDSLTMWSPDAESERALHIYVDQLVDLAGMCAREPGEQSAIRACEASRNVSDSIEGMLYKSAAIDTVLLSRAVNGITKCIEAVSTMKLSPGTPTHVTEHVREIVRAMTGRRDDLRALQDDGKMAFLFRP